MKYRKRGENRTGRDESHSAEIQYADLVPSPVGFVKSVTQPGVFGGFGECWYFCWLFLFNSSAVSFHNLLSPYVLFIPVFFLRSY